MLAHVALHGCVLSWLTIIGEFGIVYRGILKRGFSDTIGDAVAVKTLRGTLNLSLKNGPLHCVKGGNLSPSKNSRCHYSK